MEDPEEITAGSLMPSYSHLRFNIFNADSFGKHVPGFQPETFKEQLALAKEIRNEITENEKVLTANTDMIALLAFLQSIPPSAAYLEKQRVEIELAIRRTDRMWANETEDFSAALQDPKSAASGEALFQLHCSMCHGHLGQGIIGPNLTDAYWLHGSKNHQIAQTIKEGVSEKGMPAWREQFSPTQIGQLVRYIHFLEGTNPPDAMAKQGKRK